MKHSVFLLLMAMLGGCDVHSKNPANADENVTIKADEGGNVAFNVPFVKGEVKVPSGFMHNGNFDIDGVKLMPGSQVTGVSVDAHDNGAVVNVAFTAPAPPGDVRSYFVDQFKKQGVEAALAGDSVSGKSKDGSPFAIQVGPAASGSEGKIVIQSKD
jgi:hypothetical protein